MTPPMARLPVTPRNWELAGMHVPMTPLVPPAKLAPGEVRVPMTPAAASPSPGNDQGPTSGASRKNSGASQKKGGRPRQDVVWIKRKNRNVIEFKSISAC